MMPVAQGNKWLMDGIIKIDSKLISVHLLKTKSPESISLVMDTFSKITMSSQQCLFVYGFTHNSMCRDWFQKHQEIKTENSNTFYTVQIIATVLKRNKCHKVSPEDFMDILKDIIFSKQSKKRPVDRARLYLLEWRSVGLPS